MGKRLLYTTNSIIKHALRNLWLRSREHQAALKRDNYSCQSCGAKQSRARGREVFVEVHHVDGIDWSGLFDVIRKRILQDPSKLVTLCKKCHEEKDSAK